MMYKLLSDLYNSGDILFFLRAYVGVAFIYNQLSGYFSLHSFVLIQTALQLHLIPKHATVPLSRRPKWCIIMNSCTALGAHVKHRTKVYFRRSHTVYTLFVFMLQSGALIYS